MIIDIVFGMIGNCILDLDSKQKDLDGILTINDSLPFFHFKENSCNSIMSCPNFTTCFEESIGMYGAVIDKGEELTVLLNKHPKEFEKAVQADLEDHKSQELQVDEANINQAKKVSKSTHAIILNEILKFSKDIQLLKNSSADMNQIITKTKNFVKVRNSLTQNNQQFSITRSAKIIGYML